MLTIPNFIHTKTDKELVSGFLKSNTVLSNAYKEAKAVDNIHKLLPEEFKKIFKEHLKTVECEEHDACLIDNMFVDFTCDDVTCTELTVDTNGKKNPNQPGMDKYKFDITEEGVVPQGEQESCIGYDCGKFVLTYHKLFEGLTPYCVAYSNGVCTTCDDGYHQEGGKCSAVNLPNCDIYTGENCSRCESQYLLQAGECITMESQNCLATENGSTCTTCKDKYHNNNGVCEEVTINNCATYTGDTCATCDTNYHLFEEECYADIAHCPGTNYGATCSIGCETGYTGDTCTSCAANYHMYSNVCYPNIAHCPGSNYATTCPSCETGYSGSQCESCATNYHMTGSTCYANKAHCTAYNANNCTACESGYKVSGADCVEKYPGKPYIAGLNKYVWVTGQTATWENAKTLCSNAGMYLPNINELNTAYNYRGSFGSPTDLFWSSSEDGSSYAYDLYFSYGIQSCDRKNYNNYVLCLGNP